LRQRARAALRPRAGSPGGARPRRLRRSCRRAAPAPGAADRRTRAAGGGLRAGPCADRRPPHAVRGGLGAGARAALTRREPIPTEVVPGRPRRRIRRGGPARWDGGMSETIPSPDYNAEKRLARTTAVTLAWWVHGIVRLLLAIAMTYYGVAKLVFGQFGFTDMGDALIAQGEMSPMGVLWRMVALSPLFQFLAGLAEFGAALALLWRRTVPLGAALAAGSMALVFVLNLGYDVPVKQISLILLIMSVLVLVPWMPRLARALLGHGAIRPGPVPVLMPWRPLAKVTGILGPVAGLVLLGLVGWHVSTMYPERSIDETAPAGVWA